MIITHENKTSVVLVSLEDYDAMTDTYYLLGLLANARNLLDSITELEADNSVVKELI